MEVQAWTERGELAKTQRTMTRLPPVIALLVLVWGSPVAADSPYALELKVDLPVIALGAAVSLMALIEVPPPECVPRCSSAGINALDRSVLGNYSEGAHTAADIAVASLLTLPLLFDAIDTRDPGWIRDTVVFGEALLLAQALTQLTKFAVRRNAPFVYGANAPDDALRSRDASRSFISGHTTMAFAATTAYSVTFWQRHPDSSLRWVVASVGAALSLGVGLLKIAAGYHFVTDVVAGALVGAGIGALVPLLHVGE
jgi:membrane-associated phospholipid phosphatase